MEKKARSYLELQHNARYYIGIDNNRVGPKQPSNRLVTDSRLERPSPFQVTFFFCDFFWLVAHSEKRIKIDESLCVHQQPTSLTPIKPALTPICTGVGI
jgi:hypothetical protein